MINLKYRYSLFTYFLILVCITMGIVNDLSAHPSWGIVVDKNRNIYFADIMHNGRGSVWKLNTQGELELLFKDFHAHNVSLDNSGNLVTAHGEMDEHIMIRLNSNGKIDTLFHATDYRMFNGGNCAYSPRNEIVFQAEKYFWRIKENGVKEKINDHIFAWNQTVYADNEGNYYGPDIGDEKGKLIKINKHGEVTVLAENLITKTKKPYDKHADVLMGITKGCDGKIYIAELAGQRIIKINDNESTSTFYKSDGDWIPTGIDFFSGDAYVLEYKETNGHEGPRIVKIDEGGKKTVIFNYDSYSKSKVIPSSRKKNKGDFWFICIFFQVVFLLLIVLVKSYNTSRRVRLS